MRLSQLMPSIALAMLIAVTANAVDPPADKTPATDPHHDHDHADASEAVIASERDGDWSSPETWAGGAVPGEGDRVLIRRGHAVRYDVDSDQVIRGIQISGSLTFATDRNTRLDVGLIRIEDGDHYHEDGFDCHFTPELAEGAEKGAADKGSIYRPALEIGTADAPLAREFTAMIRLHYIDGMDRETCPAIVCCGGRMDLHGAPLERTWIKLPYQTAKVGEARAVLPYPLPGWQVGDQIVFSGTTRQFGYIGTRYRRDGEDNSVTDNPTSEQREITGMRRWGGLDSKVQIVSFDRPLEFDHLGAGDYRAEVANLTRNVVIESADPDGVRGHTMYHANSAGGISYAEFRHLGKRDVLGKYPIHYHLVGDSMRGSSVVGASVWDSHNRWITVHGTQYLVVKDCVGYQSVGHGYFLEDGTEVYNIFDRNLAIQALGGKPLPEQVLPFDQNLGSGYWWSNSLNTFTRNVAVECDEDGFRLEVVERDDFDPVLPILQPDGSLKRVDIRTLPFVRFDGNETHCQRLFGINLGGASGGQTSRKDSDVEGVGPDYQHPFVLRNTKIWNTHWAFHGGSPCVKIEDCDIYDCAYGIWRTVMHRHEYLRLTFNQVNTTVFFPRTAGDSDYTYSTSDYFDLAPIDDLPPVTVVTSAAWTPDGRVAVRGVTSDNYDLARIVVDGRTIAAPDDVSGWWEIEFDADPAAPLNIIAHAEDVEGNVEQLAHELVLEPSITSGSTPRAPQVADASGETR